MHVQFFFLEKAGHAPEDYEDALGFRVDTGRFALADGATESSFAGNWANLLVGDFIDNPDSKPINKWVSRIPYLRQQWLRSVAGRERPWYAEAKLREGAAATFLGLVIKTIPILKVKRWHALAVGDSCLFQFRRGTLITKFPVQNSAEFGSTPYLVNSCARARQDGIAYQTGNWRAGDRLWLMTDALAQWFLRQREQDQKPEAEIEALLALGGKEAHPAFADWIGRCRREKEMRNDDVTLIAIKM